MTMTEQRVVLIKPGDVLIIGNVGVLDEEDIKAAADCFHRLGFEGKVAYFANDITIDSIDALTYEAQLMVVTDRSDVTQSDADPGEGPPS